MQKKYDCLKVYLQVVILVINSVSSVNAVDSATLSVAEITAGNWSLKNAVFSINNINRISPYLSLQSAVLILPPPLNYISLLDIRCQHFLWYENFIDCSKGRVRFNSDQFNIPDIGFSYQFKNNKSHIKISQVPMFGGVISFNVQEKKTGNWQVFIQAKDLNLEKLYALFPIDSVAITHGQADLEVQVNGEQDQVQELTFTAVIKHLSAQEMQQQFASEDALIRLNFSAQRQNDSWQWQGKSTLKNGGIYIEPVYVDIDSKKTVTLHGQGVWLAKQKRIQVNHFILQHSHIMTLQGSTILSYKSELSINQAEVELDIPQLRPATPLYILPFLEASAFSGIDLSGSINTRLTLKQDDITEARILIRNLKLDDTEQRLNINQANADIFWVKRQENSQPSYINWQYLKFHAIPFQPGQLNFSSFAKNIELLDQANLEILGGTLSINHFSFSSMENNSGASIAFDGNIKSLSLEQLSKALNWTPLTGSISGYIPAVHYKDRTLSLDGELKMQVFDGDITIKNLASSGVFTGFSQFDADIEFDHLDLAVITKKFHTGYIEGRLSGSVQNLHLENWQPVSFYAWLGTPEDDDSTHRISQKAVENIASIGGGNVSDVLSRGVLGFFSTFGYSKLGLGCYLYQGVCQLMGVEAVDNGFYLIKGGGLPRINVIGYNPRLDWNELLIRLSRITASDEVIIE